MPSASGSDGLGHEWPKDSLVPTDIVWLVRANGERVLGLKCRSTDLAKQEPWNLAKRAFISILGQDAMYEVNQDAALKAELKESKATLGLEDYCLNCLQVRGICAFGIASNKLTLERAAFLALAVTAALGDRRQGVGSGIRPLVVEVERAMLSEVAAVRPLQTADPVAEAPWRTTQGCEAEEAAAQVDHWAQGHNAEEETWEPQSKAAAMHPGDDAFQDSQDSAEAESSQEVLEGAPPNGLSEAAIQALRSEGISDPSALRLVSDLELESFLTKHQPKFKLGDFISLRSYRNQGKKRPRSSGGSSSVPKHRAVEPQEPQASASLASSTSAPPMNFHFNFGGVEVPRPDPQPKQLLVPERKTPRPPDHPPPDHLQSAALANYELRNFSVARLQFTQRSCSPIFQCGRSLEDLVQALLSGQLKLTEPFLVLRVVEREPGKFYSTDNRRLYCLQEYARRIGRPVIAHCRCMPHRQYRFAKRNEDHFDTDNDGRSIIIREF